MIPNTQRHSLNGILQSQFISFELIMANESSLSVMNVMMHAGILHYIPFIANEYVHM